MEARAGSGGGGGAGGAGERRELGGLAERQADSVGEEVGCVDQQRGVLVQQMLPCSVSKVGAVRGAVVQRGLSNAGLFFNFEAGWDCGTSGFLDRFEKVETVQQLRMKL
jgi:hypothetical protein